MIYDNFCENVDVYNPNADDYSVSNSTLYTNG